MSSRKSGAVRAIGLIGPNGAGKTTLFEALLHAAGVTDRQGVVGQPGAVGDASPEAKQAGQSVEMNLAGFSWLGDRYALIDYPGSVEYRAECDYGLAALALAIVVLDPGPPTPVRGQPGRKALETLAVPRGSLSTRTTHPGFLHDLGHLLPALGLHVALSNPFEQLTKGEVYRRAADAVGAADAARLLSASHPCAQPDRGPGFPHSNSVNAAAKLQALFLLVTLDVFPGLAHAIDERVVDKVRQYLASP